MNPPIASFRCSMDHLSPPPSWNVFSDALSGTLFCATRGDDALPFFLLDEHWRYRGRMGQRDASFRGFDHRVADYAARQNGFYVFTSLGRR